MTGLAALLLPLFVSITSIIFGYDEAELVFVGDAMQHAAQCDAARCGKDVYDFSACYCELPPCVAEADFAVANLETPVGRPPYGGYPCFGAPASFAKALTDAGFDMLLTANNHTLDRGAAGIDATIATLDSLRVRHIGTYSSDSVRAAALPCVVTVNNIKIGFLNYTYGTNGITPSKGKVVDYIDRGQIKADVDTTRAAGAELVAVCIHWGDEYVQTPNRAQKHTADFLEAIGVDMIIGAHPHVIQPMELRPNKYIPEKNLFIAYSLGNFISNMKTADTRGGALAKLRVKRDDHGRAVISEAGYKLLFTIPGVSPTNNFKVYEASKVTDAAWQQKVKAFSDRAHRIFDNYNIAVPEITD